MTALDDLNASVANLQNQVGAENTELANVANALNSASAQIATLQQQIASGGGVSAADLEGVATQIKGVADSAANAVAAASAPTGGTPATPPPAGGGAPAPTPTPDPGTPPATPPTGTPPEPTPTPTPDTPPATPPTSDRAVYTFDGDPTTVDAAEWPASGQQTNETPPRLLYFYAGDANPGDHNGDGLGGVWHLYTGATQPVASA